MQLQKPRRWLIGHRRPREQTGTNPAEPHPLEEAAFPVHAPSRGDDTHELRPPFLRRRRGGRDAEKGLQQRGGDECAIADAVVDREEQALPLLRRDGD